MLATYTQIRWMIRRDMQSVLYIENESSQYPWSEEDFIRVLRQRDTIGMVAERDGQVAAFMIYELHKNRLHLLSLAVARRFRRMGIGSAMVAKLCSKLSFDRRNRIMCEVRERNLVAHQFLSSQGFRAISVLRDFCEDSDEDAYLFQKRMEAV